MRELRFRNALSGVPGPVVQAFLKLKSGRWRLEDWSDESEVTLCRDEAAENVTELIVATSNALATGGPFGRTTHEPAGSRQLHAGADPGHHRRHGELHLRRRRGDDELQLHRDGDVRAKRDDRSPGYFGGDYPDESWARYDVTGGTITYSGNGTSYGCTVEVPSQTAPLADIGVLALEPGPEPRYGIRDVSTQEFADATFRCPPENEPYPGDFLPPAGVYTPQPRQTMERGTYVGTSSINEPGLTASYSWNLSEG